MQKFLDAVEKINIGRTFSFIRENFTYLRRECY